MKFFTKPIGLFSPAPDLLKNAPSLIKMKERFPWYVARAEKTQVFSRNLARDIILPKALEVDARSSKDPGYVDWELWRRINKTKATIGYIPERLGGLGWSGLDAFVFLEECVTACTGISAFFGFNFFGVLCAFVEFQPDVCLRVIREMVEAHEREEPVFWAWSITEPSAGTDVEDGRAMATMKCSAHAKKVPGGYLINGTKQFCSNGSLAQYLVVTVCTDRADPLNTMATFLVHAAAKGFSVGRVERKCGQKGSQTAELFFEDVFVPDENIWEPPGRGLRHTREILSVTRGIIGMLGVGIARGALERCIQFASATQVRGHCLIEENWVQIAIADMLKDIMVVRAKCYDFAIALDTIHVLRLLENLPVKAALNVIPRELIMGESLQGLLKNKSVAGTVKALKDWIVTDDRVEYCACQGSVIKVAGTDLSLDVASRVLDIVGIEGMAYCYGMEKSFRDAKGAQIYEGTNQANRLDIFHHELGRKLGL
ncbi:MAG: acyl-CoA dehydrogenase family protein [Desulfomonilia bacterium]|nr:acyl-CoA dehydrogenase family protein [Desulfomonilia bacterium]